jgi:Tfp pilus assembly protein PilN
VIWSAQAAYANLGELSDAIARLAAEPPRRCKHVVVTLEHPPVQLRTLSDLPPVNARALAALVAHQAGRFFRKNGKPLATDAVWVANGASRVARAAAVEEPLVEAIVAGARAAGLSLERITPADENAPLLLLPMAERAARRRAEQRLTRRLTIGAASVWLAAGVLFACRLAWERRAVEREFAALGGPLGAVLAARRELRQAELAVRAVTQVEQTRGRSLALLGAVAAALPDSAVVTSLNWKADGGVISGLARRAADVVARLERSGALPGPRLEGPTVRETAGGREWERFTIAFGRETGDAR